MEGLSFRDPHVSKIVMFYGMRFFHCKKTGFREVTNYLSSIVGGLRYLFETCCIGEKLDDLPKFFGGENKTKNVWNHQI